jgi:hypothetical protein
MRWPVQLLQRRRHDRARPVHETTSLACPHGSAPESDDTQSRAASRGSGARVTRVPADPQRISGVGRGPHQAGRLSRGTRVIRNPETEPIESEQGF